MAVHPHFREASELAEQCLEFIHAAEREAAQGNQDEAKRILQAIAALCNGEWFQTLQGMSDDLAAVHDGDNSLTLPGGRSCYLASAHDTFVALFGVFAPVFSGHDVPIDLFAQFGVDRSLLHVRMRCERARLLKQLPTAEPGPQIDEQPASQWLVADVNRMTITLDGVSHDVDSEDAVRWVKVLADRSGEWVSSSELKIYDIELDGSRPDRLKRYLPEAILSLIQSNTRKGSRIVPPSRSK